MDKMENSINRRTALAGGLGVALGSFLTAPPVLGEENEGGEKKRARRPRKRPVREETWKYVPLDPAQCAQRAYDLYDPWGCMYCAVKAGILEYAAAIEAENPELAESCRAFPFIALRSGKTGCGAMESLCGAVNGAGFFMGLFVKDYGELCQLIKQVGEFVKETPMPQFVPADDKHPHFVQSVSHSILCKENTTAWLSKDPSQEHKMLRPERCKRYTGTVLGYAVELLNDYFSKES